MKVYVFTDRYWHSRPSILVFSTFEAARAEAQRQTTATSTWVEEVISVTGERAWQNQLDGNLWIIEREVES